MVEWLGSEGVLDCDGCELVLEPDGWHYPHPVRICLEDLEKFNVSNYRQQFIKTLLFRPLKMVRNFIFGSALKNRFETSDSSSYFERLQRASSLILIA